MRTKTADSMLDNLGHVDGWTLAGRDVNEARRVVASGEDLATLATPHMPARSLDDADHIRRFNEARRRQAAFPSRARPITDERIY